MDIATHIQAVAREQRAQILARLDGPLVAAFDAELAPASFESREARLDAVMLLVTAIQRSQALLSRFLPVRFGDREQLLDARLRHTLPRVNALADQLDDNAFATKFGGLLAEVRAVLVDVAASGYSDKL